MVISGRQQTVQETAVFLIVQMTLISRHAQAGRFVVSDASEQVIVIIGDQVSVVFPWRSLLWMAGGCNMKGLRVKNSNTTLFLLLSITALLLTPSLLQPVKFLGWKMHRCACKQYISCSYNTSTFNAMGFQENPFTGQREKRGKKGMGFKFCTFTGLFFFKWHHGSEGVKKNKLIQELLTEDERKAALCRRGRWKCQVLQRGRSEGRQLVRQGGGWTQGCAIHQAARWASTFSRLPGQRMRTRPPQRKMDENI